MQDTKSTQAFSFSTLKSRSLFTPQTNSNMHLRTDAPLPPRSISPGRMPEPNPAPLAATVRPVSSAPYQMQPQQQQQPSSIPQRSSYDYNSSGSATATSAPITAAPAKPQPASMSRAAKVPHHQLVFAHARTFINAYISNVATVTSITLLTPSLALTNAIPRPH